MTLEEWLLTNKTYDNAFAFLKNGKMIKVFSPEYFEAEVICVEPIDGLYAFTAALTLDLNESEE